ncbi:GIY-YIG nuclease family protein [Methylorubrum populi]|nr:GIY-YIG nuclease family protein [Methylorubrum populi]
MWVLIRNYGLFWKLDDVFFGRPGAKGHLLGRPAKNKTGNPVDFREQQGVYVLYDENYKMVYVGQAGANDKQRLWDRLNQHTSDHIAERWTKFSWFGLRGVKANGDLAAEAAGAHTTNASVLNHIEAILIAAAEPPHNRQGGRFGEDVVQYLQHRDEDALGPDVGAMILDIWEARKTE